MLSTVLGNLSDLANAIVGAMGTVVGLWPVAIMLAFLLIGVAISFITKLAGGRKGKRRKRG